MDSMTIGFLAFTWVFMLWLTYYGWHMIQSILELNDKIFRHVGLVNEDEKLVEGQMSLADFSEEE